MPTNLMGDHQAQKTNSHTFFSLVNLTSPTRRVSTGSNGYYSGNEPSPDPSPVSPKTSSLVQPTASVNGGDLTIPFVQDFSQPPPTANITGAKRVSSWLDVPAAACLPYISLPIQCSANSQGHLVNVPSFKLPSVDLTQHVTLGQGQQFISGNKDRYLTLTPDLFKMSPCLRSAGSPCADDLGNYAMHINQMELVWHGEFDRLFAQYYPHAWYLVPTFYPPSDRWRVFKDSAKVRFSCQECGHGWTSMKGRVIFWFHLNYSTNSGYVMFKLYGQQCQKCKNGSYEHAMWYPEEVVKVIGNVYNRVGQIFYGFVRPPLRIDRRQGKPRNQHNADLCQACKEGLCKEEWSFS